MLYRFGARRWLCRIMISWGIVSAATAFVVGPKQLLRPAPPARDHGGRVFSRRDVLSRRLVPAQYRTRMLAWFLVGIPLSSAGRRASLRHAVADGRDLGARRMAMAVSPGEPALHSLRLP